MREKKDTRKWEENREENGTQIRAIRVKSGGVGKETESEIVKEIGKTNREENGQGGKELGKKYKK